GHVSITVSQGGASGTINTFFYQADANYSNVVNPNTYQVTISGGTPNNVTSAGTLSAGNGIQLPDRNLSGSQDISAGTFSVPQQAGYVSDGNFITVLSGDSLTPAEWVAMVQRKTDGTQPLILSGAKGHGFAVSGGSLSVA